MTKLYEQLLGGEREDFGLDRFSIADNTDQLALLDTLSTKAELHELEEETVRLGDVSVFIDEQGIPFFTLPRHSFQEGIRFSPWSLSQLSEKMNMGAAGYMKKCLVKGMNELVPLNLNEWLRKNSEKEVVFRYQPMRNMLRAVVSQRYGFFDHTDIVDCLRDVYSTGAFGDLKLEAGFMSPDNLQLRIVAPDKIVIPGVGNNDGSTIGMSIRNGQTGQYSAEVEFMVYTFICSNGLFIGTERSKVFSRKHFSINKDQFKQDLIESLERFPDYIAAVSGTLEQSRNIRLGNLFNGAATEAIDFLKKYTGISKEEELTKIVDILKDDWDSSLWGLSGAVTQYAQTVGNSVNQYQLEQSAGKIIQEGLRLAA